MTDGSCTPKQDLLSTTVNMITIVTRQHRRFLSSGARLVPDIHDLCPRRELPLSCRCVVSIGETDLAERTARESRVKIEDPLEALRFLADEFRSLCIVFPIFQSRSRLIGGRIAKFREVSRT